MDAEQSAILKTYRHLRMGMIAVVGVLAVAVVTHATLAGCWQTSISAYYYTSAHSVFIAVLCALGTCLIVYQGNSDTEDAILNFAGFLAFIVAMVPTSREPSCGGPGLPDLFDASPGVANNVFAVFFVAIVAELLRLFLRYKADPDQPPPSHWAKISTVIGYVVIGVGAITFVVRPDWFEDYGHTVAAVTMFIGIVIVMVINAVSVGRSRHPQRRGYVRAYRWVAVFMVVSLAGVAAARAIDPDFRHLILWTEVAVLAAFVMFWVIQTRELWRVVDRRQLLEPGADPTGR